MTRFPLRQYQQTDVTTIAQRRRVLHCGAPGVGKTVIASRAAEQVGAWPCLIVCPGYLVDQWKDHLYEEGYGDVEICVAATVASRLDPRNPSGPPSQRAVSPGEKQSLLDEARANPHLKWVILNYESARRKPITREKSVDSIWAQTAQDLGLPEMPLISLSDFDKKTAARGQHQYRLPFIHQVIADEAHRLRGHRSQQFRGVYQMASMKRCEAVTLLTATPIYRDVGDLYAPLRILDPRRFTSYWRFIEEYALLDEDEWGTRIIGSRPAAQGLLRKYSISREYADPEVQLEIPPCIPRRVNVTMSPRSTTAYNAVRTHDRTRAGNLIMDSGTRITELRKITAEDENKLTALKDLIEDVQDGGYIVFAHYREVAQLIARTLGIPLALGGQKGNTQLAKSVGRSTYLDRLTGEQHTPMGLAATIDCLQEGIDLSHLQAVIYYECDYLPGKHKQSRMRVQRWRPSGDNSTPVLEYFLIARGTIDTHIYKVAHDRGADADTLMEMEYAS